MQYTLYIRKNINDEFKDEPDKSKLVNELLSKHYRMGGAVNIKQNKDGTISPRRVGKTASFEVETEQTVEPKEPQIFSRVKDYGGQKLCKHGNPKGSCFEKAALRLKCNF